MGRRRRVEAVDAMPTAERQAFASAPEDIFVELFAQVFGIEKVNLLAHEYPVEDIYGTGRLIDYAIRTNEATFSTTHHSPLTTHDSPITIQAGASFAGPIVNVAQDREYSGNSRSRRKETPS
jgi:hypothetical protein